MAFAFSTWARTLIGVGGRVLYAYLTHWMGIHNINLWKLHGTSTLKEFEKETVIELRRQAFLKRLREINAVVNEAPLRDQNRSNSFGNVIDGARAYRNRKATRVGSEAV